MLVCFNNTIVNELLVKTIISEEIKFDEVYICRWNKKNNSMIPCGAGIIIM